MTLTGTTLISSAILALTSWAIRVRPENVSRAEAPILPALLVPSLPPAAVAPRPRVPHITGRKRRVVTLSKAVDLLIASINIYDNHGLMTAGEIDAWWQITCDDEGLEPIDPRFIREELEARRFKVGQKRLNTPEYIHVRQRTGKTRVVLYRIPRCRGMAAMLPEEPATTPATPVRTRPCPGSRPAMARNARENRRYA